MADFIDASDIDIDKYEKPITLEQISKELQKYHKAPIVAAKVDHVLKDLQFQVEEFGQIEFIDMDSKEGMEVYQRTVIFLLITVVHELFDDAEITIEHSIGNGLYCEIYLGRNLKKSDVVAIEKKMRKIVAENRKIEKKVLRRSEAALLFMNSGQVEKANLIASLAREFVSIYYCGEFYDYLYGAMLASTEELSVFALDYYAPGIILRVPTIHSLLEIPDFKAQPKLAWIFSEAEAWARILDCSYVDNLNQHNKQGSISDLIRISEALHEKKIAYIADYIAENIGRIKLILIAGPSSSGKTTFAQRLRIQLRVNGIRPISISLDDYFLDRLHTPRDEEGNYDFEALEALDVELFNEHLSKLVNGESVEIPYYNFVTGKREYRGNILKLLPNQPIIVEGIHGLNEKLTAALLRNEKYKIYISALTQLAIDGHNRIPTTDTRLLRRMVRDHQFRGSDALKTIKQWPKVRAGEEKNIFPYQEEADIMFNSALIYELGILKKYAEPLLKKVEATSSEYAEVVRLLDFLEYFDDIKMDDEIPLNSILQEFIGKSCFVR